ncbi:MAG: hypothetical protein ABSB76_26070 [Streptosporangiaceae bacterium]
MSVIGEVPPFGRLVRGRTDTIQTNQHCQPDVGKPGADTGSGPWSSRIC